MTRNEELAELMRGVIRDCCLPDADAVAIAICYQSELKAMRLRWSREDRLRDQRSRDMMREAAGDKEIA